jgi:uncharacterized protein YdaU (DUF1376 family)
MPMYWGDYHADTRHLSLEAHGAYLLLIGHYWHHGPLPDDPGKLRRIIGANARQWERVWPVVRSFFELVQSEHAVTAQAEQANAEQLLGKCWRHKRIDAEIEKAETLSTKRQLAGQRGGLKSSGRSNNTRHIEQAIAKQTGHHPQPHINKPSYSELAAARAKERVPIGVSASLAEANRRKGWTSEEPETSTAQVTDDQLPLPAEARFRPANDWRARRDRKHAALDKLRDYADAIKEEQSSDVPPLPAEAPPEPHIPLRERLKLVSGGDQ